MLLQTLIVVIKLLKMGDVMIYIYKVAGEDTPANFTPINIGDQYTNHRLSLLLNSFKAGMHLNKTSGN